MAELYVLTVAVYVSTVFTVVDSCTDAIRLDEVLSRVVNYSSIIENIDLFAETCDFHSFCPTRTDGLDQDDGDIWSEYPLQQCPKTLLSTDQIEVTTHNESDIILVLLKDEESFNSCNFSTFSPLSYSARNSVVPVSTCLQLGDNFLTLTTLNQSEQMCLDGARVKVTVLNMTCSHKDSLCSDHGNCTYIESTLQCHCDVGWNGRHCENLLEQNMSLVMEEDASGSGEFLQCFFNDCSDEGTLRCMEGVDVFKCVCHEEYTGEKCDQDVDECEDTHTCTHGTCVNLTPGYRCDCIPGYFGKKCDKNSSACASSLCSNHGTCQLSENDEDIVCSCDVGYTGSRCEMEIDECFNSSCSHNSSCIDLPGGYRCVCEDGFTGVHCEVDVDECGSDPCKNGGKCFNLLNAYSCNCPIAYTSSNCGVEENECLSDPCMNGGSCFDLLGRYYCACAYPFKGERCELTPCDAPNPCFNGAICNNVYDVSRYPLGFFCKCLPGFEGVQCSINTDECSSSPCNVGHCIDGINKFQCLCPAGYEGLLCKEPVDNCISHRCEHGSQCVDEQGGYSCQCRNGWEGVYCEHELDLCQKIDPCQNGGSCVSLFLSYKCICQPGFSEQNCTKNTDECYSNPCLNGGTCYDSINNYTCTCPALFTGVHCEHQFNPCEVVEDYCYNGGVCGVAGSGKIACNCTSGFAGLYCERNIDECSSNPCRNGARCWDGIGGYLCYCLRGFGGKHCEEEVDVCDSMPCYNGGTCFETETSYGCLCPEAFTGIDCDDDVNECMTGPVCKNGGTCVNTHGSFLCLCERGFVGDHCETDVNECHSNPCLNNGSCVDQPGFFSCSCAIGFTGKLCETNIDNCIGKKCSSHGTCIDLVAGYRCSCVPGWTGENCELKLDQCDSDPCLNNATCISTLKGFKCICIEGFTGENCDINLASCRDVLTGKDLCENGVCVEEQDKEWCLCQAGYAGVFCEEDLNECDSQPCRHNSSCINTLGSFICRCKQGYYGTYCQYIENACLSNPCLNDGICIATPNLFKCDCKPGFYGNLCQHYLNSCDSSPCRNNGTCIHNRGLNKYTCVCVDGYQGLNCETILFSNTTTEQNSASATPFQDHTTGKPNLPNQTDKPIGTQQTTLQMTTTATTTTKYSIPTTDTMDSRPTTTTKLPLTTADTMDSRPTTTTKLPLTTADRPTMDSRPTTTTKLPLTTADTMDSRPTTTTKLPLTTADRPTMDSRPTTTTKLPLTTADTMDSRPTTTTKLPLTTADTMDSRPTTTTKLPLTTADTTDSRPTTTTKLPLTTADTTDSRPTTTTKLSLTTADTTDSRPTTTTKLPLTTADTMDSKSTTTTKLPMTTVDTMDSRPTTTTKLPLTNADTMDTTTAYTPSYWEAARTEGGNTFTTEAYLSTQFENSFIPATTIPDLIDQSETQITSPTTGSYQTISTTTSNPSIYTTTVENKLSTSTTWKLGTTNGFDATTLDSQESTAINDFSETADTRPTIIPDTTTAVESSSAAPITPLTITAITSSLATTSGATVSDVNTNIPTSSLSNDIWGPATSMMFNTTFPSFNNTPSTSMKTEQYDHTGVPEDTTNDTTDSNDLQTCNDEHKCLNGGRCIKEGKTSTCRCLRGWRGAFCESASNFILRFLQSGEEANETPQIVYPVIRGISYQVEIKMKFTHFGRDGLLLYIGDPTVSGLDYLKVFMNNNRIMSEVDLGGGSVSLSSQKFISPGTIHNLHVNRSTKYLYMEVDREPLLEVSLPKNFSYLNIPTSGRIYVGGLESPIDANHFANALDSIYDLKIKSFASLKYCLGNAVSSQEKGEWIDILQDSVPISSKGVKKDKKSLSCEEGLCDDNAMCINTSTGFICLCDDGWKGVYCDWPTGPCDDIVCANGGTCLVSPSKRPYCSCALGFQGETCQETIAVSDPRFNATLRSWMSVSSFNMRRETIVTIQLKTHSSEGLLFYIDDIHRSNNCDFLSISLVDSHVQLEYSLGPGSATYLQHPNKVITGLWYEVHVSRMLDESNIFVSKMENESKKEHGLLNTPVEKSSTHSAMKYLDVVNSPVYLGGHPRIHETNRHFAGTRKVYFTGCIRKLVINGYNYNLSYNHKSPNIPRYKDGRIVEMHGANIVGCDESLCGYQACLNRGECKEKDGGKSCLCIDGWIGSNCEQSILCNNSYCSDSTCLSILSPTQPECYCKWGWVGPNCLTEATHLHYNSPIMFNGHSFLKFNISSLDPRYTYLQFDFISNSSEGLLLWIGKHSSSDDDHLSIGLVDSHLQMSLQLGFGFEEKEVKRTSTLVSDSRWHRVRVFRRKRESRLYLDDKLAFKIYIQVSFEELNDPRSLYIGGFGHQQSVREESYHLYNSSYVGCIRDFYLNNDVIGWNQSLVAENIMLC